MCIISLTFTISSIIQIELFSPTSRVWFIIQLGILYPLSQQLQQYKASNTQEGDKPKENGTVQTGSPENGEQQTKVHKLYTISKFIIFYINT